MKTKDFNVKEPVKLRSKRIKNGNQSLYLDIYFKGKRKYEFLRLYVIPEQNRADREQNRRCLQLAQAIRTRRLVELQESRLGRQGLVALSSEWRAHCSPEGPAPTGTLPGELYVGSWLGRWQIQERDHKPFFSNIV